MNRTFKILLMAAVILLEMSVLSRFRIWSAVPNYMFAFLLAITCISPEKESVIIAGACGLAADILSGSIFGLNALLCIYLTTACALFVNTLYIKKMKVIVPMAFVLLFLYELLFGVLCFLVRKAQFSPWMLISPILPSAVLGTALFVLVYLLLGKVRFEKKRKGIKYEQ